MFFLAVHIKYIAADDVDDVDDTATATATAIDAATLPFVMRICHSSCDATSYSSSHFSPRIFSPNRNYTVKEIGIHFIFCMRSILPECITS